MAAHTNSMPSMLVISKKFAERVDVSASSSLAERKAAIGRVPGGRFGITAPGSQTDGFTRLALKQAGLEPGKDARIVPLQTSSNSLAALANKQIDGFIGVPPAAEKAVLEFAAVPLLVNQAGEIEGADRVQGMTVQARAEDVDENPDLYRALVRADVRAMRAIVENPEEAGALLRKPGSKSWKSRSGSTRGSWSSCHGGLRSSRETRSPHGSTTDSSPTRARKASPSKTCSTCGSPKKHSSRPAGSPLLRHEAHNIGAIRTR